MVQTMSEVEKEGKIITKKGDDTHYYNSQTAEDIQAAKELLERVKRAVKKLSAECEDTKSLKFRYKLGLFLDDLLKEESISSNLRKKFWEEVRVFADAESLLGLPGSKSSSDGRHPFLEYCYLLATKFDEQTVFSFSWHQWNDIFDRPVVLNEPRIIIWVSKEIKTMNQNQFRFFLGIVTLFMKDNDPTFFEEEELNEKCELYRQIALSWDEGIKTHFDGSFENVSEARKTNRAKYRKKYVELCLQKTLFSKKEDFANLCLEVFVEIYLNI